MMFIKNGASLFGGKSFFYLLGELECVAFQEKINTSVKTFPKVAHILSRRLKEVKSNLEDVGITFDIRRI
ncbi:hypothetical protein ABE65_018040 [Fictibacillus phosphorivorans]|uniref:Uncharacterized protein n=1 Tax=Fictibacillus phosphorivorans TaxID=1221500 RepID=A0A160IQ68_9BACL|nr:hypothetical protein ABE65_018040 [Fictibacillus phosphorivorans]